MKIAYIANSRFPSEKAQSDQVMAMCAAFAAAGHEVRLFVPHRTPVAAEDPFAYYGREKTFAFERVPCIDALRVLPHSRAGHWVQTATFIFNLRPRLAAFKPDVVYSRELYVFGFGHMPGKRVWESHSLHKGSWAARIAQQLHGIVTLTKASRERLIDQQVAANRLRVEGDAVDPRLFHSMPSRQQARAALNLAPDTFLCLYTGKFRTMGMGKGLDESAAAITQLRAEGRKIQLRAVGATPEDLAATAHLQADGITLEGHRPQHELKNEYAAADLLLMPFPYTEHYAFFMSPLKLFEYLLSGVPMVVTDLPAVREVVSEQSAFVAKPGDVPSLVACIRQAMDNPQDAAHRAAAAKALVPHYTWDARARRIAEWIQQLPTT